LDSFGVGRSQLFERNATNPAGLPRYEEMPEMPAEAAFRVKIYSPQYILKPFVYKDMRAKTSNNGGSI
jgi:hypothetical protein